MLDQTIPLETVGAGLFTSASSAGPIIVLMATRCPSCHSTNSSKALKGSQTAVVLVALL